eukprot:1963032-Rhodomonas_salina.1
MVCAGVRRAEADREEAHDGNEVRRLAVQEAVRWRTMSRLPSSPLPSILFFSSRSSHRAHFPDALCAGRRLANSFHDICGTALGSKWTRHFEKWLYSRRAECETCAAG